MTKNKLDDYDNTTATIMSYIPKKENALLGFMTYTQLAWVGAGIIVGIIFFLITKWLLSYFLGWLACWIISAIIFLLAAAPFLVAGFLPIRSKGKNPVTMYHLDTLLKLLANEKYEKGMYLNYQKNHPTLRNEHAITITNESTYVEYPVKKKGKK